MSTRHLLVAGAALIGFVLSANGVSSAEGELRLILGDFLALETGGVQALTIENRSSMPLRGADIRCLFAALNQKTHLSEDIVGWGEASISTVGAGDTGAVEVVEFHYEGRPPADHTHCGIQKVTW
ncbi:MAG: hypothetical protein ACHQAY_07865 [Hyphomicrobiales bacterium]